MKNNKKPRKTIGQILIELLFIVAFLCGLGIFLYPTISDQWNRYRQSQLITRYSDTIQTMNEEQFLLEWEKAKTYDSSVPYSIFAQDTFSEHTTVADIKDTPYWNVLNIDGNGIMGYISIPKINQNIPIYHGTSDEVLQKGVGHLSGTKLPIGEKTSHCVLAAHRGLPSSKLFTDLDQMVIGDKFYIHVLDDTLAYEVDQILPMVEKDDNDTLQSALALENDKDYITLFTCTPYGVNSHRLLVRGHRVPYLGEEEQEITPVDAMLENVQDYYLLYIILGIATAFIIIIIFKSIRKFRKNRIPGGKI